MNFSVFIHTHHSFESVLIYLFPKDPRIYFVGSYFFTIFVKKK